MNKPILHLHEFRILREDLLSLPEDHVAAVSVLSYAVSETNILSRLFLSSRHESEKVPEIQKAISMQQMFLIRTWSAKLFEIEGFLRFGGKKPTTKDQKLLSLGAEAMQRFERIGNKEGFEVARDVRHEAANHYSLKAARNNLPFLEGRANCNMYVHDQSGDCFYPLGEAVMFDARLHRRWQNYDEQKERQKRFLNWLNWCTAANRWLSDTHGYFTDELVFKPLGVSVRKKSHWVDPSLVSRGKKEICPIFMGPREAT